MDATISWLSRARLDCYPHGQAFLKLQRKTLALLVAQQLIGRYSLVNESNNLCFAFPVVPCVRGNTTSPRDTWPALAPTSLQERPARSTVPGRRPRH